MVSVGAARGEACEHRSCIQVLLFDHAADHHERADRDRHVGPHVALKAITKGRNNGLANGASDSHLAANTAFTFECESRCWLARDWGAARPDIRHEGRENENKHHEVARLEGAGIRIEGDEVEVNQHLHAVEDDAEAEDQNPVRTVRAGPATATTHRHTCQDPPASLGQIDGVASTHHSHSASTPLLEYAMPYGDM